MWLLALAPSAVAQTFGASFDLNEQRLAELGIDSDAMRDDLTATVEQELQLTEPGRFLDAFARAAALSTKGLGVDYASNADKFVFGAAMGAAVSGAPMAFQRGKSEVPDSGYAFMTALHGGVNLGVFSSNENFLDRIRIYASGLGFRTPEEHALRGRMLNVGFHGQVEIVEPITLTDLFEWGGVAATTGFEHAQYEIALQGTLPLGYTTSSFSATWISDGEFSIRSSVLTVPVELSSNIRFAPLTAYAGAGFDFDVARADTTASLSGPVDLDVNGDTEPIGTGGLTFDGDGSSEPYTIRGFFGAQIAIFAFKIYGHFNIGPEQTYGAFTGLRVAI